jgi:hypothetical protein
MVRNRAVPAASVVWKPRRNASPAFGVRESRADE